MIVKSRFNLKTAKKMTGKVGNYSPFVEPQGYSKPGLDRQLRARDATRQDLTNQIKQLDASLKLSLKQVRAAVNAGDFTRAIKKARDAVDKDAKLGNMVDRLNRQLADTVLEAKETPREPRITSKRKVKRYPMWSDK